jgi:hypothetical protein
MPNPPKKQNADFRPGQPPGIRIGFEALSANVFMELLLDHA